MDFSPDQITALIGVAVTVVTGGIAASNIGGERFKWLKLVFDFFTRFVNGVNIAIQGHEPAPKDPEVK